MPESEQIIMVVVIGLIAMIGLAVFAPLSGVATDVGSSQGSETVTSSDSRHVLDRSVGSDRDVDFAASATRGYAIEFNGSGYLETQADNWTVDNSSWSVATTAKLDDGLNQQATYNLLAYQNETIRLEFADGSWRAIYNTSTESAAASVVAESPTAMTPLVAAWNESTGELSLTTDSGSSTGTMTASAPERWVAIDWDGTIDEIRMLDGVISPESTVDYIENPTDPLPDETHSARLMFEEGAGNTSTVFYADTDATIHDGQWTDGVDSPSLEEGVDYRLSLDPLAITTIEGGNLDGAPILYASWSTGLTGPVASIIGGFGSSMELIPLIMLAILASVVIGVVMRMR